MASFRRLTFLWLRAFSVTALIVGPICVFVAMAVGGYREWLSLHSGRVQGIILAVESRAGEMGQLLYPHFSFKAADGRQHDVVSATGTPELSFHPGQQVQVVYRLSQPDSAYIDTVGERWETIMLLGGAGAVLTYLGLWVKQKTATPGFGSSRNSVR